MRFSIYIGLVFLLACANKPKDLADKACNCVKSEGMNAMMGKPSNKMERCLKAVASDIQKELKGKNKREKSLFVREFLKGVVDSDCSNMLLQFLPEDQLLNSLDDFKESLDKDFNPEDLLRKFDSKTTNDEIPGSQDESTLAAEVCDCLELEKDVQLEKSLGTDEQKIEDTYGRKMDGCEKLFESEDPKLLKALVKDCF
jgi:hypothetical protein